VHAIIFSNTFVMIRTVQNIHLNAPSLKFIRRMLGIYWIHRVMKHCKRERERKKERKKERERERERERKCEWVDGCQSNGGGNEFHFLHHSFFVEKWKRLPLVEFGLKAFRSTMLAANKRYQLNRFWDEKKLSHSLSLLSLSLSLFVSLSFYLFSGAWFDSTWREISCSLFNKHEQHQLTQS
jgi:hypothetical protein